MSGALFKAIFDSVADGVFLLDVATNRFTLANRACLDMLGYTIEEFKGLSLEDLHFAEDLPLIRREIAKGAGHEMPARGDVRFRRKDRRVVLTEINPVTIETDEGRQVLAVIRDVTERRRLEEALRAGELKYRILADFTYDWEFWAAPGGRFIYCSPSCERVTGYAADEFMADAGLLGRIVAPEDRGVFERHIDSEDRPRLPGSITFRVVRKDGDIRWIEHLCEPVFDEMGNYLGSRGSNRDITERRKAEEALRSERTKLRALAAKVQLSVENEQRRIAEDLHDHVGQVLGLARMKIGSLDLACGDHAAAKARREIKRNIDSAIEFCRDLSARLHPPALRQLGAGPAIKWLAAQTAERDGFDLSIRISSKFPPLDDATATFLYRAAQELLRNAVRHGRPRHVAVTLQRGAKKTVTLAVKDDGRGFKAPGAGAPVVPKGFGLFSLRERIEEMDGSFEIESAPEKGAEVTITVPAGKEKG